MYATVFGRVPFVFTVNICQQWSPVQVLYKCCCSTTTLVWAQGSRLHRVTSLVMKHINKSSGSCTMYWTFSSNNLTNQLQLQLPLDGQGKSSIKTLSTGMQMAKIISISDVNNFPFTKTLCGSLKKNTTKLWGEKHFGWLAYQEDLLFCDHNVRF